MGEPPGTDDTRDDGDDPLGRLNESEYDLRPLYRARPREFYLLWLVALLTYGIGDTVTTTIAVNTVPTLVESNVVVSAVLEYGGLSGLLLVKLLVFLVMLAISVRGIRRNDRFAYYWPPVATALLGVLLTGWNLRLMAVGG